jgi:hypothetical protein
MTSLPGIPEPEGGRRWAEGDRVQVCLPDRDGMQGRPGSWSWFSGTVRETDPPGSRPGVVVDLDRPVNGVRSCFATHAELRRHA